MRYKLTAEQREIQEEICRLLLRKSRLEQRTKFDDLKEKIGDGDSKADLLFAVLEKKAPKLLARLKTEQSLVTGMKRFFKPWFAQTLTSWVRPLETWTPRSHNPDRQLVSLVHHLTCKYKLPDNYYSLWFGDDTEFSWFCKLAQGTSMRKLDLPLSLTDKMRHQVQYAPYPFTKGLRWAQLRVLGADKRLISAVMTTPLGNVRSKEVNQDNHEWTLLFYMFIRNPMFDRAQFQTVYDYMARHRNFSLKGRTPQTVLRLVEEWHGRLRREQGKNFKEWPHGVVSDFMLEEGEAGTNSYKCWKITQLLNSKELNEEGRKLKHCVWSYADSCFRGLKSIWSMTLTDVKSGTVDEKRITIEQVGNTLVQIRGSVNRLPTQQEMRVIGLWASKEGLTISAYTRHG